MKSHSSDAVDSSLSKGLRWSRGLDPARPSKEGARYAPTVRVGRLGTRLLRLLIIRSVLCLLITVFYTCAFNAAFATTYYVDGTNGQDMNNCKRAQSVGTAKRTINGGVSCLSGGDTLIVRAGTYNEFLDKNNIPSGASWPSGATTIRGYPGDARPTMNGSLWISVKSNIIWNGININGVNDPLGGSAEEVSGVMINGGTHIRITNSEIYNCGMNCILTHDGNGPLSDIEFTYLKVHDAGAVTHACNPACHNFYISAHFSTTGLILVDHTESYNATQTANSWGIQCYSTTPGFLNGVVLSNNYVHDNSEGILVGSGSNHQVYNNIVANNGQNAGSYQEPAINVSYGAPIDNVQVYNNTVYNNAGYGIGSDYGSPTNTKVRNNILWQNGHSDQISTIGTGATVDHNLQAINPQFVNQAANDFHLTSASPARNAGVNVSSVFTTDTVGIARPAGSAYDIGAYQYVGVSSSAPAAPQNLHLLP